MMTMYEKHKSVFQGALLISVFSGRNVMWL